MRITLISPRIAVQKGDFLGSGVPYWPVDMAVFAAFLRGKGHAVSVLDLFGASPTTLEDGGDHYLQGRPLRHHLNAPAVAVADLFILYAMSYMSHGEMLSLVRVLRERRPGVPVAVWENSQAVTAYDITAKADDFFNAGAAALLCGEPYWNWDQMAAFLSDPQAHPAPENVMSPSRDENRPVLRWFENNPRYPVPAWDLFDLQNYWSIPYSHGPKSRRYLPILTSRGCPYPCDFCVVPQTNGLRWRGRPPEDVVDEMIALRNRFGVRHFQVEDLNPTVNSARWQTICRLLVEREAGIYFSLVSGTKAETVKLEHVPLYAQAGCRYISISPESGSPAVLKAIGKPFNHAHGLRLIEACRRHGIATQACILVGHPAEKEEDFRMSCDYLRAMVRAGLDEVAVFVVAPIAGSRLFSQSRIDVSDGGALTSFSPRGRRGWEELSARRIRLIRLFFLEKLRKGPDLWLQGLRSLFGTPRTKMENLPLRAAFIYRLLLSHRLRAVLG